MRGLKDRVVIVTGGGGGIGNAVSQRLGEEGAIVAIFDLNGDAAEKTAAQIHRIGARAQAYVVDITDQARVITAVAAVEHDLGPVGALINNAGWDHAANFLDTDTALFKDFCGEGEYGEKLRGALTRAIPFGRLGQPCDLAGAVCFLVSDDAAFITGQVLSVSGGLTMAG